MNLIRSLNHNPNPLYFVDSAQHCEEKNSQEFAHPAQITRPISDMLSVEKDTNMNLIFENERAWFARMSVDDRSCPRSTYYAVLLPDVDEEAFRENKGLEIASWGATDGGAQAVKFANGHYALISREYGDAGKFDGPYVVDTSDDPAVTFALWHADDMPMPCKMARSGRQMWFVPGAGKVYMYYNEKKEDMNYEPDHIGKGVAMKLVEHFGGYPIVLEIEDKTPFSLNYFLVHNRLYQLGDWGGRKSRFAHSFIGGLRGLTGETCEARWNREVDPKDVVARIGLLAQDLEMPIRLVRKGDDGAYRWEGPFSG